MPFSRTKSFIKRCVIIYDKMEVNTLSCVEYTQYLRDYYWINKMMGGLLLLGIAIVILIIFVILRRKWFIDFRE